MAVVDKYSSILFSKRVGRVIDQNHCDLKNVEVDNFEFTASIGVGEWECGDPTPFDFPTNASITISSEVCSQ